MRRRLCGAPVVRRTHTRVGRAPPGPSMGILCSSSASPPHRADPKELLATWADPSVSVVHPTDAPRGDCCQPGMWQGATTVMVDDVRKVLMCACRQLKAP